MTRPRILDLFCGAGGAAMGYHRAGFDVVGVDIEPQKNFPFEFIQDDALAVLRFMPAGLGRFDAIHASPPCQAYGSFQNLNQVRWGSESRYPRLIEPVRDLLVETDLPWVIENTERAPLREAIKLCGSSFGLRVRRHRLFESNMLLMGAPVCQHNGHRSWDYVGVYGSSPGISMKTASDGYDRTRRAESIEEAREAMGIDWMDWDEIVEAIPPAYTEWIGTQLLQHLQAAAPQGARP